MKASVSRNATTGPLRNSSVLKTGILCIILAPFFLTSCASYVPVKKLVFFVKNGADHTPLRAAHVAISHNGDVIKELSLDSFGHTSLKLRTLKISPDKISDYTLKWYGDIVEHDHSFFATDSVKLNKYIPLYDLYLVNPSAHPGGTVALPVKPTADMHYHISMRVHNYFGKWQYPLETHNVSPSNLDWFKSYSKLKIVYTNEMGVPSLRKVSHDDLEENDSEALGILQRQIGAYDKPGSNKFTQYTQATFPHLLEGNVQLAYDAISPFERATSITARNRLASNLIVTGATPAWMRRIGQVQDSKRPPMTHWKNFNLEYNMMTQQDTAYNHFNWRFLREGVELEEDKPTIVIVVEGSHIFQDTLFPNYVNFNIGKRTVEKNTELLKNFLALRYRDGSADDFTINRLKKEFIIGIKTQDTLPERIQRKIIDIDGSYKEVLKHLDHSKLDSLVQITLENELRENIDSLKRMDPPICMMAISHLAYNGMTGHSVAWDQGGFIANLVARRNYGIRVSNEYSYRKQWEGAFFSVPGVNAFGKLVINGLISKDNGHRILIDLKHSAPSTRQFFIDSIMVPRINATKDTLFPICSHCGVNGFPKMYSSPFVNEYNITRAPFVHALYPFAINLYNEEIAQICKYNGIIGIPLEQRILGSYINKIESRSPKISISGKKYDGRRQFIKRWNYTKRYMRHLFLTDTIVMKDAISYTKYTMGVSLRNRPDALNANRNILQVIFRDYKSAEPFLYNVFHVIDHSGLDPVKAWHHVCIGSDLDGLIDPIDICPTASQYPKFRERLKQFIPIFLKMRQIMNTDPSIPFEENEHYFDSSFTIDDALDELFFQSLFDFTNKRMLK